jgi:hypothetical protein
MAELSNNRAIGQASENLVAHPPGLKHWRERPVTVSMRSSQVRDNWGDLPTDWDPNSLHMFVGRCAWRVVLEYQRQLHEDVDFSRLDQIHKVSEF